MQLRLPYLSPKTGVRRNYHRIKIFEFCIAKSVGERRHIFGEQKQTSPYFSFPYPKQGYYLLIFFSEFGLAVEKFEYIFSKQKKLISLPPLKRGSGVLRTPGKVCKFFIAVGVSMNYRITKTNFPLPSLILLIMHCFRKWRHLLNILNDRIVEVLRFYPQQTFYLLPFTLYPQQTFLHF